MISNTPCPSCRGNLEILSSSKLGEWNYECRSCNKNFTLNIKGEMKEKPYNIFNDIFK